MTNKDPFEFPPAGKVRFLDVPVIDNIVIGNPKPLSTGFKLLEEALRKHPIKSFHITAAVPPKDPSIVTKVAVSVGPNKPDAFSESQLTTLTK